jgi:hypothetical protein
MPGARLYEGQSIALPMGESLSGGSLMRVVEVIRSTVR